VFVPLDQAFEVLIQRFGGLEVASEQFAKDPEVLTSVSYLIFFLLLQSAIYVLTTENRSLYY
jgi:hypothetical protein